MTTTIEWNLFDGTEKTLPPKSLKSNRIAYGRMIDSQVKLIAVSSIYWWWNYFDEELVFNLAVDDDNGNNFILRKGEYWAQI